MQRRFRRIRFNEGVRFIETPAGFGNLSPPSTTLLHFLLLLFASVGSRSLSLSLLVFAITIL